jgi:DNA adenine methylase
MSAAIPRPFLKWAGGKTRLLPKLLELVDRVPDLKKARYHEPFLGGGALFFELARTGRLGRKKAYLSDLNAALANAYRAVQYVPDGVILALKDYDWMRGQSDDGRWFYAMRDALNKRSCSNLNAAALLIAVNKTCFNGLWRVNKNGEFNVPFGRYKNPTICDEPNLRACSDALQQAQITCRSFVYAVNDVRPGDLVYFDPPYHGTFASYNGDGFNENMQWALAASARYMASIGAHVIVSNSDTPLVRELYADFQIDVVDGHRAIQANGKGRGKTPELLIHNLREGD